MGTDKNLQNRGSTVAAFVAFLAEPNPGFDFVPSFYHVDPKMLNGECYQGCARPGLPSHSMRYSKSRTGAGKSQTDRATTLLAKSNLSRNGSNSRIRRNRLDSKSSRDDASDKQLIVVERHQFTMHVHPEGLPYFQQDQFVTSDNVQDLPVQKLVATALVLVCYMLKHLKDTRDNFSFHEDVDICIELESLNDPPEFNYYIADHKNKSIFWADDREPASVQEVEDVTRGMMLREEYWKHVEYYPCHRVVDTQSFEELKQILAAYATDAATSEGSTSPMSANDIRAHLKVLNSLGTEPSESQTWITARIFCLFIRARLLNRYGTQDARLDRFDSLEHDTPSYQDHYAMINFYLILGLGDKHLIRCARTWADRIAYTQSWREYKSYYLGEWKEIRNLAGMMLIACSHFARIHSLLGLVLQRLAAIASLLSMGLSYHLSNQLQNTGDHAADAAIYFQMNEELKYGIQRLSLWNCGPQALLCWSGCLFLALLIVGAS